jgi:hypothetical protein
MLFIRLSAQSRPGFVFSPFFIRLKLFILDERGFERLVTTQP